MDAEAGPEPLDPVLDDPERAWMDSCLLALVRPLGELGFEGRGEIPKQFRGGSGRVALRRPGTGGD